MDLLAQSEYCRHLIDTWLLDLNLNAYLHNEIKRQLKDALPKSVIPLSKQLGRVVTFIKTSNTTLPSDTALRPIIQQLQNELQHITRRVQDLNDHLVKKKNVPKFWKELNKHSVALDRYVDCLNRISLIHEGQIIQQSSAAASVPVCDAADKFWNKTTNNAHLVSKTQTRMATDSFNCMQLTYMILFN